MTIENFIVTSLCVVGFFAFTPWQPPALRIYVGPRVVNGIVQIDSGISNAIIDIRRALTGSKVFALVDNPDAADLALYITARHVNGNSGSVAVPAGSATVMVPIDRHVIRSVIVAGNHEKALTSDDGGAGTWRHAARRVVKDVEVWAAANRTFILR